MFSKNRIIPIIISVAMAAGLMTGCGKKKDEVMQTLPEMEIQAYKLEDCIENTYYVKHGDMYYPLQTGIMNWTPGEEEDSSSDENLKTLWFGSDDALIPTLYTDDRIVYIGPATFTQNFQWKRFQDDGYTVGIRGLTKTDTNKYAFIKSEGVLYPESTAYQALMETVADESILVFDKINGTQVVSDNVAPSTTIKNLNHNEKYTLDLYLGTAYGAFDVLADTHAYSWMESFETSEYVLNHDNYAEMAVPSDWKQGYYMINDAGLFRYINAPSTQGATSTEFNEKYYAYDEEGKVITDEDGNKMSQAAYDEEQKRLAEEEEARLKAENGETEPVETKEEKIYKTELTFDSSQESITVYVTYSDCEDDSLCDTPPSAKLVAPSGDTFDFSPNGINTLVCKDVDTTISDGKWTVEVRNVAGRTFNVSTEVGSGNASSFLHSGEGTGSMTYHVDTPRTEAAMMVTWENTSYVAQVKIKAPDGTTYGDSDILEKDDGFKKINIGDAVEGDYTIEVDGTDLGRVKVSVVDGISQDSLSGYDDNSSNSSYTDTSSSESSDSSGSYNEPEIDEVETEYDEEEEDDNVDDSDIWED